MARWLVTYQWPGGPEHGQVVEATTPEHAAWQVGGQWREGSEPLFGGVVPAQPEAPLRTYLPGQLAAIAAPRQPDIWALVATARAEWSAAGRSDLGARWVMDLATWDQMRAAAETGTWHKRANGSACPYMAIKACERCGWTDPTWKPDPADRLWGLPIEVRDDAGPLHLEASDG